jgi:hypothetical protein
MAYMAFRKGSVLGTNGWQGAAGTTGWLQITTHDSFIPKWVDLTAPDTANVSFSPKDFTIYRFSNGCTTKTTLLTVNGATGWKSNERRRFYILSASAYTTLGINVTSVDGGSYVMINDLDFGTDVVTTTDIRSILPANSNSFGIVRTNSLGVIDIDNKYRTGRREGASGGNRITFLDWKYFSAVNTPVSWNLPFGNADYKIHEIIVTDTLNVPGRYSYQTLQPAKAYSTGFYGLYQIDNPDRSKLIVSCEGGGIGYFGNFKTSGFYVCILVEVIE